MKHWKVDNQSDRVRMTKLARNMNKLTLVWQEEVNTPACIKLQGCGVATYIASDQPQVADVK